MSEPMLQDTPEWAAAVKAIADGKVCHTCDPDCVQCASNDLRAALPSLLQGVARLVREEAEREYDRGIPTDQSIGWAFAADFIARIAEGK